MIHLLKSVPNVDLRKLMIIKFAVLRNEIPTLREKLISLQNTAPLMKQIGAYMVSSTQRKIREGKFAPNSPATIATKKGNKPLQDSGQFIASITHKETDNDRTTVIGSKRGKFLELLMTGGKIKPQSAKKLAFPANAQIKHITDANGGSVRKTLDYFKSMGWKIFFTDGAIMGDPSGAKRQFGLNRKVKVLFIRKASITLQPRNVFYVDDIDRKVIADMTGRHIEKS
jgi:phage gpG-like protein